MIDFQKSMKMPGKRDEGIVLIIVLWVLTSLAVLTLSFSRESRIEVLTARNAQSMERSYYIARAGMEDTIYQIIQRRMTFTSQMGIGDEPHPVDLGRVTGSFDGGFWQVNIQDESGKINLNTVSEQQLGALMNAVDIEEQDARILVDSILDWRSNANAAPRPNGAKDDYYLSLDERDLRSCYYHKAKTTVDSIYKISSCFPVIEKYILHEFTTSGVHVILRKKDDISEIERKMKRILSFEFRRKNYFSQRISDIKDYLINELR